MGKESPRLAGCLLRWADAEMDGCAQYHVLGELAANLSPGGIPANWVPGPRAAVPRAAWWRPVALGKSTRGQESIRGRAATRHPHRLHGPALLMRSGLQMGASSHRWQPRPTAWRPTAAAVEAVQPGVRLHTRGVELMLGAPHSSSCTLATSRGSIWHASGSRITMHEDPQSRVGAGARS